MTSSTFLKNWSNSFKGSEHFQEKWQRSGKMGRVREEDYRETKWELVLLDVSVMFKTMKYKR